MKPYCLLIFNALFSVALARAQNKPVIDTGKINSEPSVYYGDDETRPEFPGGLPAFGNYISKNLIYPEVARLLGINGHVNVSFLIDKDGSIVQVTPINCIGAGCEAEAVKVIANSPRWKPGTQNKHTVKFLYAVPIAFRTKLVKVSFKSLANSSYGFLFNIKGKIYTAAEAQQKLGDNFSSTLIEIAEPFYNDGNNPKFSVPDKKGVYLVQIKG